MQDKPLSIRRILAAEAGFGCRLDVANFRFAQTKATPFDRNSGEFVSTFDVVDVHECSVCLLGANPGNERQV
jgi:hypothetical protein